jgi:hypothetical protein
MLDGGPGAGKWNLEGDRLGWLKQPPHALHVLAFMGYSKAGAHAAIATLNGIVSELNTCTALHVEDALMDSLDLHLDGHPKVIYKENGVQLEGKKWCPQPRLPNHA